MIARVTDVCRWAQIDAQIDAASSRDALQFAGAFVQNRNVRSFLRLGRGRVLEVPMGRPDRASFKWHVGQSPFAEIHLFWEYFGVRCGIDSRRSLDRPIHLEKPLEVVHSVFRNRTAYVRIAPRRWKPLSLIAQGFSFIKFWVLLRHRGTVQ